MTSNFDLAKINRNAHFKVLRAFVMMQKDLKSRNWDLKGTNWKDPKAPLNLSSLTFSVSLKVLSTDGKIARLEGRILLAYLNNAAYELSKKEKNRATTSSVLIYESRSYRKSADIKRVVNLAQANLQKDIISNTFSRYE